MFTNICLNESFFIKRGIMKDIVLQMHQYSKDYSGLMVCSKGYLTLEIENNITEIKTNQIISFKPFTTINEIFISADCEVTILGIHHNLSPQIFETVKFIDPNYVLHLDNFSLVDISIPEQRKLEQLFDLFEQNLEEEKSIFQFQKVNAIFTLMLYEIIQLFYNKNPKEIAEITRAKIITSNFFILLNTNINQSKGVEYFAKRLHITPKHLISSVKEITKETPRKVINRMLLKEAEKLLKEPDNSIQSVAEKLGFSDASAFIKFFKRTTGFTPKQYKKIG